MATTAMTTTPKFSVALQSDRYQKLINNTLRDPKKADRFIAAVSSAVGTTPALQACEAGSIITAALLGEALGLSPSPQLGQYYMVPYNDTKAGVSKAQFQLGYKGYIQLAIRSGYYTKLNVQPIKEGELIRYNPLEEELVVKLIEDETVRENTPDMGYYAMFEYANGFRKILYWSREKMEAHADRYSKAFKIDDYRRYVNGEIPGKDMWKYSSHWYKDFSAMACKTMLRQIISKWGIMSVEMQEAFEKDMAVINDNGTYDYVDSPEAPSMTVASVDEVSDLDALNAQLVGGDEL